MTASSLLGTRLASAPQPAGLTAAVGWSLSVFQLALVVLLCLAAAICSPVWCAPPPCA
jgi:hypothetical protein